MTAIVQLEIIVIVIDKWVAMSKVLSTEVAFPLCTATVDLFTDLSDLEEGSISCMGQYAVKIVNVLAPCEVIKKCALSILA